MTGAGTTRYGAEHSRLGDQPIVVLHDRHDRRRLRIALHGAALLGFEVPLAGAMHDLADGYRDADEVRTRPGSRFAIMVPFAGRIADARYRFEGVAQDLAPGVSGSERASRHGFVRDADFVVAELVASESCARVVLGSAAIRPRPGFPHAINLGVSFTLDGDGITLEARMQNIGDRPAPCFFGWHPYFRLPGDGLVDDWALQIPAQTLIRTGANLIALPGDAAYVALDDAPELDFRAPRRIGDSILDQGYTRLEADPDGRIRTHLRYPASGMGLAVWQERGVMHAFTADTLGRAARRAVALEPMECMADAFNRPECAAAIRLEPGAERRFRCGVEVVHA
ncbi:MAG: aldose epimerase [Rhodanobacter sp.]